MLIDPIKSAINRAYDFNEKQQKALDEGQITEAEWFEINKQFFTAHYLSSDNPRAQAGHSGDEARWRYSRGMIIEAIHKSGTFLDVGCANGHLIETLSEWLKGSGLTIEFYGLDISEGLVESAKKRLPYWQNRIFLGNALYWKPQTKYDFVRTGLEYVPIGRQKDYVDHLLNNYISQNGRLIIGLYSEIRGSHELEETLINWGYNLDGYCEKSKPDNKVVSYKMLWIDK